MTSLLCSKVFTASSMSKREITTSHLALQVKPARKRCSSQKLDGPQVPQHSCFSPVQETRAHSEEAKLNETEPLPSPEGLVGKASM